MVPGPVARDPHFAVATPCRIPRLDGRQPPLVDQLLELGDADALQLKGRPRLGHPSSLLRHARNDNRPFMSIEPGTAIVTGAGKRVGAVIAKSLVEHGWTVVAHVRSGYDTVPAGAVRVVSDLSDPQCAAAIFAVAQPLPPVRLLVNNAARFVWDGFGEFSLDEFEAHMAVNLRAPILLTEAFAAHHRAGGDALVINILDAKLAAPNPDFLSYTLSKQALAGFTELAARALASKGIRVNGIAPALMLRSPGQDEGNFLTMHASNPLGCGVEPTDVVEAIRYLMNVPAVTGEVLVIDGGQRFSAPKRDVQFLETP